MELSPMVALATSFLFGILHGILPDEHTWPITFSYAIGAGSGRRGLKAGLLFSAAFTVQRALLSEAAKLALAPILLSRNFQAVVYFAVGAAMTLAGLAVSRRWRYPHFHLFAPHRAGGHAGHAVDPLTKRIDAASATEPSAPPLAWTLVHGFIAGFSFGGFSLYVNTIAAPAMPTPWMGFLPGLLFGAGSTAMLALIGALFGAALRWTRTLTESAARRIGSLTGRRTLFFGGLLFTVFGVVSALGWERFMPVDMSYALIALFMLVIAVPALVFSWREVVRMEERTRGSS